MLRTFRSIGLAVAMVAALAAGAAAAPQSSKPAAKPAKSSMASHSVTGTLEKFDPSDKMLTLKTAKGTETLTLGTDARIREGSQTLSSSDLSSHAGSRVRVSYVENNGQKTAREVSLTANKSSAKAPKKS